MSSVMTHCGTGGGAEGEIPGLLSQEAQGKESNQLGDASNPKTSPTCSHPIRIRKVLFLP